MNATPLYIISYGSGNNTTNNFNNQSSNQGMQGSITNQYASDQKIMEHYEKLLSHANEQIAALTALLEKLQMK